MSIIDLNDYNNKSDIVNSVLADVHLCFMCCIKTAGSVCACIRLALLGEACTYKCVFSTKEYMINITLTKSTEDNNV